MSVMTSTPEQKYIPEKQSYIQLYHLKVILYKFEKLDIKVTVVIFPHWSTSNKQQIPISGIK